MKYAETGYVLEVDLTRGNIEKVSTDPALTALHLGGEGAAARTIWERVAPEVDPLSPKNLLIFSAGLLHGTPVPGANRTTIGTISPQTNLYVTAGLEGFFGPELKQAGYDQIVIRGKSRTPVYLFIHNDRVELRDAGHLTGKSALETAAALHLELKDAKLQVAAIGPAGENRVFQATVDHANSSASQGVGVVMGDKGLKAIAIRGTKDIRVAHPVELFDLCHRQYGVIYDTPECGDPFLREEDRSWHAGNLAYRNEKGRIKGYPEVESEWALRVETEETHFQWENYSQEMEEVHEIVVDESKRLRGTGCFNCPKNCHEAVYLPGRRQYLMKSYSKLAYALAAHGEVKLDYDILFAMQQYGVDEPAMVQAVAFALALYRAGVLTESDLPDFPADARQRCGYLVDRIARREGVGDLLAQGLDQAARRIGPKAEAYLNSVKKIDQLPLTRSRLDYPYFLMHATGAKMHIADIEGSFPQLPIPEREARQAFVAGWEAAPERFKKWFEKWEPAAQLPVEAAVEIADWNEAMHAVDDALGICPLLSSFRGQFGGRPPYHLNNLADYAASASGLTLDSDGLAQVAARNRAVVRAINVSRGMVRADETVPQGLWDEGEPELEQQLLDAYYQFRGWNRDGVPTRESLEGLQLGDVAELLEERGLLAAR